MALLKGQVATSRMNIPDKHFSFADINNAGSFPEFTAHHRVGALPKLLTGNSEGKTQNKGWRKVVGHAVFLLFCIVIHGSLKAAVC